MWCSHAWVRSGGFIVDITSDQFGSPAVNVTAFPDGRYRPGVDEASTLTLSPGGALALEPLLREWREVRERTMVAILCEENGEP
jgi:hypothetical protein